MNLYIPKTKTKYNVLSESKQNCKLVNSLKSRLDIEKSYENEITMFRFVVSSNKSNIISPDIFLKCLIKNLVVRNTRY